MFKYIDVVAAVLLVVGGLNWGLFAFFDTNLVSMLFEGTIFSQITYGLIALSAIYQVFTWKQIQTRWQT